MLVHTQSTLFRADFAHWRKSEMAALRTFSLNEEGSKILKKTEELIIEDNGFFIMQVSERTQYFLLVLFGEVNIPTLMLRLKTGDAFHFKNDHFSEIRLENTLNETKADILIFQYVNESKDHFCFTEKIEIQQKNEWQPLSTYLPEKSFIGLFEGRKHGTYAITQENKSAFFLVLNGAFECQEMLLENRDAALIHQHKTVNIEALSQDALLLLTEV